jgi:MOSC domain-containing protein YiiM
MQRCDECGFAEAEHSALELAKLPGSLAQRLNLALRKVPRGLAISPHREVARNLLRDYLEEGRLHDAHHLVSGVSRQTAARAASVLGPGRIVQLNVSGGGVPKHPVDEAAVGWRGLEGDRHANPLHHGHPSQSLCLWSLERIEALAEEGHPIRPGFAGENPTISGLDWSLLRPGIRFSAGEGVLFETTAPATPCNENAGWFLGGDYRRMSHTLQPGWSRWYASVLSPGHLAVGDLVTAEPPLAAAAQSCLPTRPK